MWSNQYCLPAAEIHLAPTELPVARSLPKLAVQTAAFNLACSPIKSIDPRCGVNSPQGIEILEDS